MAAAAERRTTKTILVVDRQPGVIEILATNLKRADFRVISARTGAQALARASREKPDLILLDAILPDLDGVDVCRQLKDEQQTSQIPVIMIGAKAGNEDIIAGIAAGAEDYVAKPFGPSEVVALVEAHLRREERGRNADRLTRLPGSTYITSKIATRIAQGGPFAVMYVDMNSLEGFVGAYGFARGERAIQLLSEAVSETVQLFGGVDDLAGYLGGSRFVVVTTPERAENMCKRIIGEFDTRILDLYQPIDLDRGYVEYERQPGQREQSPIMSVSIAVVTNKRRIISSHVEASVIASELSNYVRRLPGSNYCFDRRQTHVRAELDITTKDASIGYRPDMMPMEEALSWISVLARALGPGIALTESSLDSFLLDPIDNLDSRQVSNLELIQKRVGHLAAILKQLESLGGLERDAAVAFQNKASLKEILDLVVGLVKELAEERGVEVYVEESDGDRRVMLDGRSLIQGLFYLLRSEIYSSEPGDCVVVRIRKATRGFITVQITNQNHYFSPCELANLLRSQPERMISGQRTRDLDLAMALLGSSGGELKVKSKEGEGTTLSVLIPEEWRSRAGRINRLQYERERSGKAARAQLANIHSLLSSTVEQAPSDLVESLEILESKVRELEVLCNLSLLLADDLSSDLERQQHKLLEAHGDHLVALEAMLVIVREAARLAQVGDLFDLNSSRRVSRYARAIAAELQLPSDEQHALHHAALLKDLGPALARPEMSKWGEGLTADGQARLAELLSNTAKALSRLNSLAQPLSFVSHKYERYDGTGYPFGLKGKEIPLGARILAVAEFVEALIWGLWPLGVLDPEVAIEELAAESGRRFDPHVVSASLQALRKGSVSIK